MLVVVLRLANKQRYSLTISTKQSAALELAGKTTLILIPASIGAFINSCKNRENSPSPIMTA